MHSLPALGQPLGQPLGQANVHKTAEVKKEKNPYKKKIEGTLLAVAGL